mgnify:CR=1 FL=1
MDSRQFADRVSSNQGFLTHFEDWAFRMASRADFYSRMSIFEAQMREDGSLEAHEKKDGRLVYNYKNKIYIKITHICTYMLLASYKSIPLPQFHNKLLKMRNNSTLQFCFRKFDILS